MRWPLVLFAGALAACGLQPRGADISLEGGSIIGSVVKRAPVLTIVVPSDVQTKGFDSATPVLGDVPTYIVQGDRYRINIDLAKRPLDVSKLVSTQVAERNAYQHVERDQAGKGSGLLVFPRSSGTVPIVSPVVEWQCDPLDACKMAERIVSSLRADWPKLEGRGPPPEAPEQRANYPDMPPPPAVNR